MNIYINYLKKCVLINEESALDTVIYLSKECFHRLPSTYIHLCDH